MVYSCCITDCDSKYPDCRFSFHQIPTGKTNLQIRRRQLWIDAIGRTDINYQFAKVCGKHFETGKPAAFNEPEKKNWIPTLFMSNDDPSGNHKNIEFAADCRGNGQLSRTKEVLPNQWFPEDAATTMNREPDQCFAYEEKDGACDLYYSDLRSGEFGAECRGNGQFPSTTEMHSKQLFPEDATKMDQEMDQFVVYEEKDEACDLHQSDLSNVLLEWNGNENDDLQNEVVFEEDEEEWNLEVLDALSEEWLEEDASFEHMAEEWLEAHMETNSENGSANCCLKHLEIDLLYGDETIIEGGMNLRTQYEERMDVADNDDSFEHQLAEKDAEISQLKLKLQRIMQIRSAGFDLASFEGNDAKTCHFTGLPNFTTLKIVFNFVQAGILVASQVLSKEQVFMIVLIRLRLNWCFRTLGYIFNVSTATVSKYFYSGLYSLYKQLRGLVKWPEKELLDYYTPLKFKKVFSRGITSIIDCFEIFSEKPSTKDAVLKMYSNYKSHYTTKFLISITPFGSISYISKPYTGRTSDKQITESSGYLDNIQPDDLILADRGFSIQKMIHDRGGVLKVPDSSTRKRQLSSVAVERTRALASVRNEVERSIGALRGKYPITKGPVSITLMNHEHNGENVLHMAVTVCCALINLCPSIIK